MSTELACAPAGEAPASAPRAGVPLQTRGVVQPGAMYVARAVDNAVVAALRAGQWAVILGPRFCGKSSLRARTARALQSPLPAAPLSDAPVEPLRCATIELRTIVQQQQAASSGAACLLLCSMLATQLRLPAVSAFWQRHSDASPSERLRRFLLEQVVDQAARTVILIDDLDALAMPPLEAAEVLGVLRQVQQELLAAGAPGALTVGAFSAQPLSRLVADGAGWQAGVFMLPDFTRRELDAFAPALAALCQDGESTAADWLDAVFAWTGGHPQLTQHLCQQLVARAPVASPAARTGGSGATPSERVERLLRTLYLDPDARDEALQHDPCVREMVQALTSSPRAQALLALYRRLLSGTPVTPDPLDELQRELRLCGLSTEAEDPAGALRLRLRCRLLTGLLGEDWAREQEVRLVLQEAIEREPAARTPTSGGALLRGSALKTAQAWARKHPAALRPAEIRVLLASLEAARSEVEAKHQSSAAALQRELRAKTEGGLGLGLGAGPSIGPGIRIPGIASGAPQGLPGSARPRRMAVVTVAAICLVLCASLAALASAYRRMARLEHASREAAARAQRAEQALQLLHANRASLPGSTGPEAAARAQRAEQAPETLQANRAPLADVTGPMTGAAQSTGPGASGGEALAARATRPARAPERRKPASSGKLAKRRAPPLRPTSQVRAAARGLGTCPVPGRSAD